MKGVIAYIYMKQVRRTERIWDISYGFHKSLEIVSEERRIGKFVRHVRSLKELTPYGRYAGDLFIITTGAAFRPMNLLWIQENMTLEHETDHYLIYRLRTHGAALPFPHTHSRADVHVATPLLPTPNIGCFFNYLTRKRRSNLLVSF